MISSQTHRHQLNPEEGESRYISLWEVASVVVSCLIAEWTIYAFAGKGRWIGLIPIVLALALMILSHKLRAEGLRQLGFRFDNFLPSLRLVAIPTIVATAIILLGSWWLGGQTLSLRPVRMRLFLVPAWALFQQYALQGFINRRLQLAFGPGVLSIMLVATLFSLVHLPSPLLGIVAFVGGLILAWAYQREPNLFALALSHSLASITLSLAVPPHLTNLLRFGFKYFGMLI